MSASLSAAAGVPVTTARGSRVGSVDIVRGAVMVLMAIDHVRVFSGVPAGGPTAGVFFTRWVTHVCAPAFVFLAGTSAYLYGRKHGPAALSRFLLTRGAWLVVLELTLLRLSWTFNGDFRHYEMAGVLWVIGWCMILMSLLVRLSPRALALIGCAIVLLHNAVLQPLGGARVFQHGAGFGLWAILYGSFWNGPIKLGADGPNLIVLYSIVPWIGVMALGYACGTLLDLEPARRRDVLLRIGLGATLLFVALRFLDAYGGDPNPWRGQLQASQWAPAMPAWLAFLNTSKYPASLLFLLMTLGPTVAVMALLDAARRGGPLARWLTVFGRVPFFYYVLHIPLIHALALVVSKLETGAVSPWLFTNHPMGNPSPPAGYAWSLPVLYATWAVALLILYPLCRWWSGVKARRTDWWLGYL